MRREVTVYEYANDAKDEANRRMGNTKATVLVQTFDKGVTVVGDRARFLHLWTLLGQLLNDWTD